MRTATPRHYLMCPPAHYTVSYSINPWMDPTAPVDPALALLQWEGLRDRYRALGHTVEILDPVPGLPDMVFAANGATVVDGRVLGARFANPERTGEAPAHLAWFRGHGFPEVREPAHVNEAEGDFAVTSSWLLAGRGFRSSLSSHPEAQEFFGRPVIGLELIDPRFYHLDTALAVLDEAGDEIMYYPGAFSPGTRAVLARLFPGALLAAEEDAAAFGLNAVSDGLHVLLPRTARGLRAPLLERGFEPVPVDMSELHKAGGSVKCCTLEIRPAHPGVPSPRPQAAPAAASLSATIPVTATASGTATTVLPTTVAGIATSATGDPGPAAPEATPVA